MKLISNTQRLLNQLFLQEHRENAPTMTESQYFELFASAQITKGKELSHEELEHGVLGAGNDGGCDSIYTFYNGEIVTEDLLDSIKPSKRSNIELIITQSKRETSFSEDAIMKWKTVSQNLLEIGVDDSEYQARYNSDVIAAFALFRDLYVKHLRVAPKLVIRYCYASFATEVHPNVSAQAEELQKIVKSLFPNPKTEVHIEFWDAEKLLLTAQTQAEQQISLYLSETPINLGTPRDYVALVNLGKFYRFITDENDELRKYIFESNVRDYQGHNSVNQAIESTLDSEGPEDFWWLNNGITLLADEASMVSTKAISLTDPAIVNGLQTSNEIFQYFKSHPNRIDKETRNVLVRIIVPECEDSRDRIVLATNNQTAIPKSSLRANDPIHWQIELFFKGRGLFYDRRKNYYKNQGKKSEEIVSVSFLAQCMISLLLQKPDHARARPSTLLQKDETYSQLYDESISLDVFYHAAYLGKHIDRILRKSALYTLAQTNDILFFVLYFSVAKLLNRKSISATNLKDINLDLFTETYILEVAKVVFDEYESLGGNGKTAKSQVLTDALKAKIS